MNPTQSKAYQYCKANIKKRSTPKYVKKQMREFMRIVEDKDEEFFFDVDLCEKIYRVLTLLIMPRGLKTGKTLFECSEGYQWIVYEASLCIKYRDDPEKRRYETVILEICRKNYKTFTIATLFILLFILEPRFSMFYSVAPTGALSREIKNAIDMILKSSPLVYMYKGKPRFNILRDYISFPLKESKYTPLNYSNSELDGKLVNVFCADEVGALPNTYAIEAMRSGQLNLKNKIGFIISTKYTSLNNPLESEVAYSKKVLDGTEKDKTYFALLYEPDNPKNWQTSDLVLQQANPVAIDSPEIWADLLKKRAQAIAREDARENFVTKHCNIIYSGTGTSTYIDVSDVQECRLANIEWSGRTVYLGLDLSESNDNTSVSMVALDEDEKILAKSFAFIPEDRIDEKSAAERVNYRELLGKDNVFACGDRVIDYSFIEDFIMSIEEKYGVTIQAIGFDRWNALSTAQKLQAAGYNMIEIRQHSSVLHPPTKLLKEKIMSGDFGYTDNPLYEINFLNARCVYDTNKNQYVNKKKSAGKVDMVVSTINAVYLLQQDHIFGSEDRDFTIQII